jgi:hypothetical protein
MVRLTYRPPTEQTPAPHVWPLGQTLPHAPQFASSIRTSSSQPSAAFELQSAKPALQALPHTPAVQEAVSPGPAGQTMPHALQLELSSFKLK